MKQKLTAILAAFLCTFSSFPAAAAETENIYLLPNDNGYFYGFIAQTDGTVLTEDMIPFKDDAMYSGLQGWSVLTRPLAWDGFTETTYEGDTDSVYIVGIRQNDPELMNAYARELMLALDCVVNTYLFEYTSYQYAAYAGDITVVMNDPTVQLEDLDIPEFAEATVSGNSVHFDYPNSSLWEQAEIYVEEASGGTVSVDGNISIYEQEFLYQYAESLEEKYSEYFSDVIVELLFQEASENVSDEVSATVSPWQTAGDHNADGETNSNDAAALLVQAAEDGAAEASETTVSPDSDVNLDGVADATDAAYILQYSALKGAGMDPDWVEILKK